MTQRLDAVAGMGQLITGCGNTALDWDDPRLLTWSDLIATAIWPALDKQVRTRHAQALEGFAVAHALNTDRNAGIRRQLDHIAARLNAIGVEPIVLKGAGHIATELWPTPGSRLLSDIDLLVPVDKMDPAFSALEDLAGLGPQDRGEPDSIAHAKHMPPLFGAGGPATVEIHHAIFSGPSRALAPYGDIHARAVRIDLGSTHILVPSPTDRVLHAMLHGPAGNGTYLAPRLHMRDLLDIHFLDRAYPGQIDWAWIDGHLTAQGWATVLEITNRCLVRFTGMAPPFRGASLRNRLDASRWEWQLGHPGRWRAGMMANLVVHMVRGLATGGAPRRQVIGELTTAETYRRVFRRYVLGRPE